MDPFSREAARLSAVARIRPKLLVAPAPFQYIANIAAAHFRVPIALVSVVGTQQWFIGRVGIDLSSTRREQAFCAYTIQSDEIMIVEDTTKDPRFSANPFVTGEPHVRFYAGAPVVDSEGNRLGSVCIVDYVRRSLTVGQKIVLRNLAHIASGEVQRIAQTA